MFSRLSSPVGNYPIGITGAASPNYEITLTPGTLQVTPAPLTIAAQNKTKVYGAPLPVFTATFKGFVNGDTAGRLLQPVTLPLPPMRPAPSAAIQLR